MYCMALVRSSVRQRTEPAMAGQTPVGFGYGRPSLVSAYKLPSVSKVVKADYVSNSSGGSQGTNDPTFDTKYYKHPGAAIVADPNTGVAVYDTYDQGGWLEAGGTGLGTPHGIGAFTG
jgi:hypothetical protein